MRCVLLRERNSCDFLDPALAWTGVKDSGRGVSLSKFGASFKFYVSLNRVIEIRRRLRPTDAREVRAYEDQDNVTREQEDMRR